MSSNNACAQFGADSFTTQTVHPLDYQTIEWRITKRVLVSSSEWKKRPAWVRAIFFGSGRIQMDSHQHLLVEKFAVAAGMVFVIIGLFDSNAMLVPESAKVPMLLFASFLLLAAYLMSLIVRIGNRYSVWPWVDSDTTH